MKKLSVVFIMFAMIIGFIGCAELSGNVIVDKTTSAAFYLVLQNNPSYKVEVVTSLEAIKVYLGKTGITYDDLIAFVAKQFPGKYTYLGVLLTEDLATDTPIFETYLPMLDSYKVMIVKKIDKFLLITGMIV